MHDEWEYLIHLIRCAIHDKPAQELPEGLDFGKVFQCAAFHHVANIAFYSVEKLENKPQEALYAKWKDRRDKAVVRSITQNFAAQEIRSAFQAEGIRWLEVQGTKIKPLYPRAEWRTMSDIDFIVDFENLTKAGQVLEQLGYQWKMAHEGTEVAAHRPPNINIELHSSYFPANSDYHGLLKPFDSTDETFYAYNILHIAKHYYYGGCGIRRVLDAYYLNRHYGQETAQDLLGRANATEFATELGALAESWFGEEDTFPQTEMAQYILYSGLHGHGINEVANLVKKDMQIGRFSKLKYLFGRIFCGKEVLRLNYPILERYWILYPVCWIHRVLRAMSSKRRKRIRYEVEAVKNTKK